MNVLAAPWAIKLFWKELRIQFAVFYNGKNQDQKRRMPMIRYTVTGITLTTLHI